MEKIRRGRRHACLWWQAPWNEWRIYRTHNLRKRSHLIANLIRKKFPAPSFIVNTFTSKEETLAEANSTDFGLFSSMYTRDLQGAISITKRLESGAVGVNCSVPLRALDMPVGVWKQSGVSRE